MTSATDDRDSHFSDEQRIRITEFHRALTKEEHQSPTHRIENKDLKSRLAEFCIKIIDQAAREEYPIRAVVHFLRGFPFYSFGDSLDEAFALLHELDMRIQLLSKGRPEEQMNKIREILVDYWRAFDLSA